jgi:hypothetical protein
MMGLEKKYVLDANAFIQPKRKFYTFDICPGYWDALIWHHTKGTLCSIDRVAKELERGADDLWQWADSKLPETFFDSTDSIEVVAFYRRVIGWVQAHPQFSTEAKAEFADADRADAWLIAYAKATGRALVTLEEFDPFIRKRVPIPNVCKFTAVGVECVTIFEMLRGLKTQFIWKPPT